MKNFIKTRDGQILDIKECQRTIKNYAWHLKNIRFLKPNIEPTGVFFIFTAVYKKNNSKDKRVCYALQYPCDCSEYVQSDNITELFDKFVFYNGEEEPLVCENLSELEYWFNYSKEQQYKTRECYGAVLVDGKLQYQAIMTSIGHWSTCPQILELDKNWREK